MTDRHDDERLSRRGALKAFLAPIAGVALHRLMGGCAESTGAVGPEESLALAGESAAGATTSSAVAWASGGTKAMKGGYPDPFAETAGVACAVTPAMMLGPCYGPTMEREDVSDGVPGVPMRLSFLIVRADGCTPVKGATIDIWHAGANGLYSTFGADTFCNPSKTDLTLERYCRGVQVTSAEGRADFSSVVPGWYNGRATHVHFTIRVDGKEYLTSQLFFDDALLDDIEKEQDYVARGPRDTRNDADILLPKEDRAPFLLNWAKREDGTLHAWKVVVLRDSLDEELPQAGGGFPGAGRPGFPFPDGGVPPGFPPGFPAGGFPSLDGGLPPGFPGGGSPGFPPADGGIPSFPGFPGFPGGGRTNQGGR